MIGDREIAVVGGEEENDNAFIYLCTLNIIILMMSSIILRSVSGSGISGH